jgi:NADPH2:quinone reductase
MRAIVYSRPGDSSVLELVDRDVPEPGPGEVRVRVVVSGVNPTDWKSRKGSSAVPTEAQETVPNQDGSGVIDAVGSGVTSFAPGDRVWLGISGWQRPAGGTAQEYTIALESRVFALPEEANFDLGASLGVPAVTAHRALTVGELLPNRLANGSLTGRHVLIAGGAGAVGHAAIQLARWAGANVITTVSSPAKAALARDAGAHHVINYRDADVIEQIRAIAPDGVDHVVEVAASANSALDLAVAKPRATIASYANDRGGPVTIDVGASMRLNIRYQWVLIYTMGADPWRAAGEDIFAALKDAALPIGVGAGMPLHRFPLEQTAAAHDAVEGDAIGKVLIDVAPTLS